MTLHDIETEEFNVPAVGIWTESTRGIKLSTTTDTFSVKGNATGATGIITEIFSEVHSTLQLVHHLKVMGHVETNLLH